MPVYPATELGALLRDARESASLTTAQVAVHLSRSERTVTAWERGATKPTPSVLVQLIALYRADFHKLMEAYL